MNKSFSTIIIFLLFLLIPLASRAQFGDFWIMNDALLLEDNENIDLKIFELYWSADTYVPFGYQGRTLPTQGSWVTINAYLEISGGDPENLKYSWFLDGVFQEAKSGYGQDSFKFAIRRFSGYPHTVLLKVFNESRSFFIEKSIEIPVANPEMVVYHKNTSRVNLPYIISAETFKVVSGKEASFLALPYFFNIKSLADLEFQWILGEKSVKESSLIANIFGLKIVNKEVGGSLEETLRVIATNKKQSRQSMSKLIKVNIY